MKEAQIVVTTAISGSGRSNFCSVFEQYSIERGKKIKIITPGKILFQEAAARDIRLTEENVLNTHRDVLNALLGIVFEQILFEIPKWRSAGYSIIVNIHGVFYWKDQYEEAINSSFLKKINPDIYVNFIANSDAVVRELRKRDQWRNLLFNKNIPTVGALKEIMRWQSAERSATKIAAGFEEKPFFTVPSAGNESVLYRLMFEPWRKKFYLGMPLTFLHGSKNKNNRRRIDEFARWLENYVILIDPRYVEPLGTTQLTSAHENEAVHHHVVARDLKWLIPQCDGMIGFYPDAVTSYGENSERSEVHRTNGKTFLIYPKKDFLSPFFTEWADEIFTDENKFKKRFLEYLGNDYIKKCDKHDMISRGEEAI